MKFNFKSIIKYVVKYIYFYIQKVYSDYCNYFSDFLYNKLLETNNFGQKRNISYFDIKEFNRINSENILLDKKQYNKVSIPIISIILTNYNQFHCIHKSIRSIQNQSYKFRNNNN